MASIWRQAPLGDLIEAKYGKALPKARRAGGPVPVYGSNGIVGAHSEALTKGPTIVVGRKGSLGEVNFSSLACWPIDTTYYIDEPGPFQIEFLGYLLRSLRLTERDRSTAIPGLNRDDLYQIEVPVPSEEEQRIIATILRTIEEHKENVRGHLKESRDSLLQFRRAILAAACSGGLTADWRAAHRQHAVRASDLTEVLLQNEGWLDKAKLDEHEEIDLAGWGVVAGRHVFPFVTSGSRGWARYYSEGGPAFLRVGNLDRYDIELDLSSVQRVTPPDNAESKRTKVKDGDLVISITAEIGMVAVVARDLGEAYVNQHLAIARPHELMNSRFLALFVASPGGVGLPA